MISCGADTELHAETFLYSMQLKLSFERQDINVFDAFE